MLAVSLRVVRNWENGNVPLSAVPYGQLVLIADAFNGADPTIQGSLDQLLLAMRCDVLITGMLTGHEDYADVPPIDNETDAGVAAYTLLQWAAHGQVPAEYRSSAAAGPLLADSDISQLASVAKLLAAAAATGPEVANYGATLRALFGADLSTGHAARLHG